MNKKPYGYIYKITNIINNKIYVGLTTRIPEVRWKQHVNTAYQLNHKDSKCLFKRAIRKYGQDNFKLEIIDIADSEEELKEKEIYWIKELNSYAFDDDGWGYNSTRGGDMPTEINKKKIVQCDIASGKILNTYDSIKDGERAIDCRIENLGKYNTSSGGYCFFYYEDIKDLTEEEVINKVHSLYPNLVYQLDENGKILNIYKDVPSACKELNYNSAGNIISCCLNNRRVAAGYQWCYQKDLENRVNKPIRDIRKSVKSVVRYGMDGRKIDEWESITNAAKALNLQDSHISSVCNGKRQSCGSYQWRYKEDNIDKLPPITAKRKVIDLNTGKIYQTVSSAAKDIGVGYDTIKKSCVENKPVKSGTVYFNWYDIKEKGDGKY